MIRRFLVLFVFLPFLSFGQEGQDYSSVLYEISQNQASILSDLRMLISSLSSLDSSLASVPDNFNSVIHDLSIAVQALNNSYSVLQGIQSTQVEINGYVSQVNQSVQDLDNSFDSLSSTVSDKFDDVLDVENKDNPAHAQLALDSSIQSLINKLDNIDQAASGGSVSVDVNWEGFIDGFSSWWYGAGPGGSGGSGDDDSFECNYNSSDFDKLFDWLGKNLGLTSDLQSAMGDDGNGSVSFYVASPDPISIKNNNLPVLSFNSQSVEWRGDNFFDSNLSQGDAQIKQLAYLNTGISQILALLNKKKTDTEEDDKSLPDSVFSSSHGGYSYDVAVPFAPALHSLKGDRPWLNWVGEEVSWGGSDFFESNLSQGDAQIKMLVKVQTGLMQLLSMFDKSDSSEADEIKGLADSVSVDSVRDSFDIAGTLNPLKDKFRSIDNPLPKSFNVSVPSSVKLGRIEFSFGNTHFNWGDLTADSSIYGEFVEHVRAVSIAMIYFFLSAISFYIFFFLWRLVHKYFAGFASYVGFVP